MTGLPVCGRHHTSWARRSVSAPAVAARSSSLAWISSDAAPTITLAADARIGDESFSPRFIDMRPVLTGEGILPNREVIEEHASGNSFLSTDQLDRYLFER